MATDISKHPDFQQARDAHTGAVAAARAANDELAELRADLEFERKRSDIRDKAEAAVEAQHALETALTKAKADWPLVPEELYSGISDPAAVLAAGEKASAAIQAGIDARSQGQPVIGNNTYGQPGNWPRPTQGTPPPPVNRNPASYENPDPEYVKDLNRRLQDPRSRKEQNDAMEELTRSVFGAKVLNRFDKFSEAQQQGSQQQ